MQRFTVFIIFLMTLIGSVSVEAGENLLPDGDFEQKRGWTFAQTQGKPSLGKYEWTDAAHSGKHALKLKGLVNAVTSPVQPSIYSQPVNVQEGLYRLKGWYKQSGAARYRIHVSFGNLLGGGGHPRAATSARHFTYWPKENVEDNWAPFEIYLNVAASETQMVVTLESYDIGDVLYDDVSLERIDDPLTVRIFPADYGRKVVPLVRETPSFFKIQLLGDLSRIERAELLLDLPEGVGDFGIHDDGTSAIYVARWWKPAVAITSTSRVEHDGMSFCRFRIPLSKPWLGGLKKTLSNFGLTIWVDPADMPKSSSLYIQTVVDGKKYEPVRSDVKVLPPLPAGNRPSNFHSFFAFGQFLGDDVPEPLYARVYDMIRSMGVDHLLVYGDSKGSIKVPSSLPWRAYFMQKMREDGGKLWAQIPGTYAGTYSGLGGPRKCVDTNVIAQGKSFFSIDNGYYKTIAPNVDGVFWDWESHGPHENPCWDDPATLKAFAVYSGRDPDKITTKLVKETLHDEFIQFRYWQIGQFISLWAGYVHDIRPDLTIAICSGGGVPLRRHADYKAYADIPNLINLPMIYTSSTASFIKPIVNMKDYVPNATIMPVTSSFMLAGHGQQPSKGPRTLYFDYVSTAMLGVYGISHWPDLDTGMDMEYVWEISNAMRDIASVEAFLHKGEHHPSNVSARAMPESETRIKTAEGEVVLMSPQWDKFASTYTYRKGQDILVAVCNMHPQRPATIKVNVDDLQAGDWYAYDPVTQTSLVPSRGKAWQASELGNGLFFEVPASSLGMLVISPTPPSSKATDEISEAEVRARFERRSRDAKGTGDMSVLKSAELTIDWKDTTGNGNAQIHIASADQELGLSMSGILVSWKVAGHEMDLVNRFDDGGVCMDQLWWPKDARNMDISKLNNELVSREIKDGRASVTFRQPLDHWSVGGLVIEKTYSIAANGKTIDVNIAIRNESPTPVIEFSYRSHNRFMLGNPPALMLSTTEGDLFFSGVQQAREIWAPVTNLPADQSALKMQGQGAPVATLAKPVFTLGEPKGPRIDITTDSSLLQVYRWWNGSDRHTLEWMYQRQKLPAGQTWATHIQLAFLP